MHKLMQPIDRRFVTFCASSPSRAPEETRIRRPLTTSPCDDYKTSMIRACLRRHASFWDSFCAQHRLLDHLLPMYSKHSKLAFSHLKLSTCKTEWVSSVFCMFFLDFSFRKIYFKLIVRFNVNVVAVRPRVFDCSARRCACWPTIYSNVIYILFVFTCL